ncbi:fungal specific transcription factor [Apiospora sp. TS-2023a]
MDTKRNRVSKSTEASSSSEYAGSPTLAFDFNGRSRRLHLSLGRNHTVHRIEARLEAVETGLQKIESTMVHIHKVLERCSVLVPPWLNSPLERGPDALGPASVQRSKDQERRPGNRHLVLHRDNDQQFSSGPTGLASLLHDAREYILDPIEPSMDLQMPIHDAVAGARERLDALFSILQSPEPSDEDLSPLEVPPLSIVEAMMEPYFNSIQPRMPIWTRDNLQHYIEMCNRGSSDPGRQAALICANNVVILTLATKCIKENSRRQNLDVKCTSSMEMGLLHTFFVNAKRAFNSAAQLSAPSLANVQAILSLCLIAQLFLADDLFNRMFQQAVHLTRLAGFEKSDASNGTSLNSHEIEEKRSILDCLHLIAPSVGWRGGNCTDLISTASANPGLEVAAPGDEEREIKPLVDLAQYELIVFSQAYSAKSYLPWPPAFAQPGSILQHYLETWWKRFGDGFEIETFVDSQANSDTMTPASSMLFERAWCFHTLRILMTWQLPPQSQRDSHRQIEDARITLRLMSLAISKGSDLGHFASITRSSSSSNATAQAANGSDLELLQSFSRHLQTVSDILGEHKPHIFHLNAFIKILTDLATSVWGSTPASSPLWQADPNTWDKIGLDPFHQHIAPNHDAGQTQYEDHSTSNNEFDEYRILSGSAIPGFDFGLGPSGQGSMSDW